MARADRDLAARRQQNFINQLKKHPQFKPSMLEPPKPKFKAVSLDNGPIVRTRQRAVRWHFCTLAATFATSAIVAGLLVAAGLLNVDALWEALA